MNRSFGHSLPGAALALAALCSGREGAAEAPEVRANLEVVSAGGCGGEGEITSRVVRRSGRIRFVRPGSGVRRARAELRPAANELFAATLSLWTEDGRELVRRLRPARCEDALEALSLVLLVSLDPDAELGELPSETQEPPPSEPAEPSRPAPTAAASPAPPAPAAASSRKPRRAELAAEEPRPRSGTGARYRPFAGAFASARGGPAPGWMPGFGAFAGVVGPGFPSEFAARLSVTRHGRSGFAAENGNAEFELDTVRLELCPLGWRLGIAGLLACLDGELGELEATGSGVPDPRSVRRPWRSVGVSAWSSLRPWPELELSLSVGADHPLVRDRFEFNPEVFHEVGPIGGWASLGVALSIP